MGPLAAIAAVLFVAGIASSGSKSAKAPPKGKGYVPPPMATQPGTINKWSILGCDAIHSPSGSTLAPMPGVQSHPDYQWCYVVRDGDTPGDVAALILGPDQGWRYVELITSNPDMATKGSVIAPDAGDAELNFADADWKIGRVVRLPRTWNPWIDQVGSPRGETAPYMPAGFGAAA